MSLCKQNVNKEQICLVEKHIHDELELPYFSNANNLQSGNLLYRVGTKGS